MACEAQSIADVKMEQMEPDSASAYSEPHPVSEPHPLYPQPDTSVLNYFLTLRTNVEQTSQILTDTWGQLSGLLDTYKAQLFNAESINIQPGHDDLMKLLMTKEQENGRLREELRLFNERYDSDIREREQRIQNFQTEILTLKRQKDSLTLSVNQKTRRFENKIRVLEGKLEKSEKGMKTPHGKGAKWSGRPSGRLLPGAGLVERTPTPTQLVANKDTREEETMPAETPKKDDQSRNRSQGDGLTEERSGASFSPIRGEDIAVPVKEQQPSTSHSPTRDKHVSVSDHTSKGGGDLTGSITIVERESGSESDRGQESETEVENENGSDDNVPDETKAGISFKTETEFDEIETIEGGPVHACPKCKFFTFHRSNLYRHISTTHNGKKYACKHCAKSFATGYYLKNHVKEVHETGGSLLCEICAAQPFANEILLAKHRRVKHGIGRYKCETCGKCFKDSYYLKVHRRSHTKEKPFLCSGCAKKFTTNQTLRRHHCKVSKGREPVKCQDCSKVFANKLTLVRHVNARHKKMQYTCSCEKVFTYPSSLSRHKKVCEWERGFEKL